MLDNQNNAKIPIKVIFQSEILQDGEKEIIAFTTNGLYYIKGETEFIVFSEEQADKEKVDVIYKISNQEVWVSRSGAVKMRQSFRAGEQTAGIYESNFGIFHLEIDTEKVVRMKDAHNNRGSIQLQYQLKVQGQLTGQYFITIHYEEEQAG